MNHDASKSLKRRYRRSYRPVDLVRRVPIANTREKTTRYTLSIALLHVGVGNSPRGFQKEVQSVTFTSRIR